MWKRFFLFVFLITFVPILSQTQKEIQLYKDKFFIYQSIGIDSALIYVNKIFSSKNNSDLAFAYTAKRHLLTIIGKNKKDDFSTINFYLKQIPEIQENYTDLSHIYNILGNTDLANELPTEALKKFIKADFFAQKNNDTKQHIKIKGNVAFIKLNLKQTDEAIWETSEVLKLLKSHKSLYENENYKIIYNNIFSNLGHLYLDKYISDVKVYKKYGDSALQNFHYLLNSTKDRKLLGGTYLRLGTLYNNKKDYQKASEFYFESLKIYNTLELKDETLNLKYNIAVNYFDSKEYKKSKDNFFELSHLLEKDSLVNTDYIFAQDYLSKIYFKENKKDSAEFYHNKFVDLYQKNSEEQKRNIADIYKNINSKNLNDEIDKNSSIFKKWLFLIAILIVLVGFISTYLFYQIQKKRKTEKRLNDILLQVKNNTLNANNDIKKNSFTISNEKEADIINKLLDLEDKKLYLKKEYNQAFVAKKIGTNTTYLSQTINKYMKKSFSEYSNELKINYILKELSENKKIRSYTTQALADMVGYKSGISFARTFKEKTGTTPFQYIEKLNKES